MLKQLPTRYRCKVKFNLAFASFEPGDTATDFISIIFAIICGSVTSRLGDFWFYVGAVGGFIIFRKLASTIFLKVGNKNKRPISP